MRAVERHAYKAAFSQRFEQMPHVGRPVRVRAACDLVMEVFCREGEYFPVAGFRNEHVDVLIFERSAAREQILVPQSEDARLKVVGDG